MPSEMDTTMLEPGYVAENNSASLFATSITFLVVESIFLTLLYTSRYLAKGERKNLSMEVFMTMTYILCVAKIIIATCMLRNCPEEKSSADTVIVMVEIGGVGCHLITLSPDTVTNALKLSTALQIVCPLTTSLSKLGVLCMLYRIFGQTSYWYRMSIRGMFVLVVAIMLVQCLIPFVNCRPFSKTWNPNRPGSCAIPGLSLWRYLSVPNVLTTLVVVGLPISGLVKLHVSRPVKFGLAVVFGVCVLGVFAATMRFWSFLQVKDFSDITYEMVRPTCWTIAESGIYLVAGVSATLRPLLRKLFKDTSFERLLTGGMGQSRRWRSRARLIVKPHRVDIGMDKVSVSNAGVERVQIMKAKLPYFRSVDARLDERHSHF
jgi:hypothetical protein